MRSTRARRTRLRLDRLAQAPRENRPWWARAAPDYARPVSRPTKLVLVAVGAFAAAVLVDRIFDEGRLGYSQLAVMVGSVVALWAWRTRVRA